jgi:Bacterial Ig-like domain (group 3)
VSRAKHAKSPMTSLVIQRRNTKSMKSIRQILSSGRTRALILATLALTSCVAMLLAGAEQASPDSTTPPPWDTFTPTDGATYNSYSNPAGYGSVGGLLFFNAAGQQVTGGAIPSTGPGSLAAYIEGTGSTGGIKVRVEIALPSASDPSGWSHDTESFVSTNFPVTSSAPSNLENVSTGPVYTGSSSDTGLAQFFSTFSDGSNPDAGYYQVRLYTSGSGSLGTEFNSADILVDLTNDTWTLAYPVPTAVSTSVGVTTTVGSTGVVGTQVPLTATVTDTDGSSPAGGTVQFFDGATAIGSPQTVAGTTATYTYTTQASDEPNASFTAQFTPATGANYTGSTSSALSFGVTAPAVPTTTTLSASPPTSASYGTPVTFTATVSDSDSSVPTGTVAFKDGNTVLAATQPLSLVSGHYQATFTTSTPLSVANHTIAAVYNAPSGFATSNDDLSYTVNGVGTSTTLTASPASPEPAGQSVTFTATVSDTDSSVPTGSVTFEDNNNVVAATQPLTLVSGNYQATFTTSTLSASTHPLTAVYNPPAGYASSTGSLSFTVTNTTTTLTASPSSPQGFGTPVIFTATVSDSDSSVPTGTVTFKDGSDVLAPNVALENVSGTYEATYGPTSTLSVATHPLTAVYNPPAGYPSSTGSLSDVVNAGSTTTSLAAAPLSPAIYGTSVTFTATVSDSDSSVPTGTVAFKDGSTVLAATQPLTLVSGNYQATFTTSSLSVATHSISAVYNPPTNYGGSTADFSYVVNGLSTTITLTASPASPVAEGTSVTFTATVADGDTTTPTGTVTIHDGSTVLASNLPLSSISGSEMATYTTSSLSPATHSLSAVYNPPTNYASSSSDITFVVNRTHAAVPDGKGYWLFASDGGVFTYGNAAFYGSAGGLHLNKPIVAAAATPDGKGYWLFASDGGVFTYGDAAFYGSAGGLPLNKPIVAAAATPDGKGYWLFASDGGVFTYGDAAFYGSAGSLQLNKPITSAVATPDGQGYWLFASDGGVFTYGDAAFFGSTGSLHLNKPIVSATATPDGEGYWLFASDGGVFTYGDAVFYGSAGSLQLNKPIVSAVGCPDGQGYWLFASDGGVFTYGDAAFYGSAGGLHLNALVVAAIDS